MSELTRGNNHDIIHDNHEVSFLWKMKALVAKTNRFWLLFATSFYCFLTKRKRRGYHILRHEYMNMRHTLVRGSSSGSAPGHPDIISQIKIPKEKTSL